MSSWQLKELSPNHRQVVALLAQGVDRQTIAQVCDFAPEYITWLARQPLCKAYLQELTEYADARLIALTERSVDAISDVLAQGGAEERLKAARLQLEAVGRIGARRSESSGGISSDERLAQLAERLKTLIVQRRTEVYDGQAKEVSEEDRLQVAM